MAEKLLSISSFTLYLQMLANLLEISWRKYKDEIIKNSETFNSFKSLLRKLVDMQNPQAIEIEQKLLS